MKIESRAARFGRAFLAAAGYFAAFRLIRYIVGDLGVWIVRLLLNAGVGETLPNSVWNSLITLLVHAVTLVALFLWMRVRGRRVTEQVGMRTIAAMPMTAALFAGVGANLTVCWIYELIPFPTFMTDRYAENVGTAFADYTVLTAVMTVLVAPLMEELFFRGLLYNRLRNGMPSVTAAALSALVFAASHGDWLWGMYAFAVGMLFAWVFEITGSLWGNILCHVGFNAIGQFSLGGLTPPARIAVYVIGTLALAAAIGLLVIQRPSADEKE